ncbi:MAG: glycosyltransferase family 2 protein [Mediterraneibacter gnavus]
MEKVLTVVIPSFNVEKYLRQTLESLRNEEILEDVEVLIVDDGSTDGTAKIGKEYEKRYPQTYRVISKTNVRTRVQQSIAGSNRAEEHFSKSWMEMTGSIQEALIEVVRRLKTCRQWLCGDRLL